MPDLVKFVLVILVIWVIYQLVTSVLFSLSQKAVKKRLKSNKMTDQQLVNLYHSVAKSNQYNTMQAIFSYGIFYKSHEKQIWLKIDPSLQFCEEGSIFLSKQNK